MRALPILLAGVLSAFGQHVVDSEKLPGNWKTFEKPPVERQLRCRISSIPPRLNYGFRFQTGFSVEVPLRQEMNPGRHWSVVLRVTPLSKEHQPVWLLSRMRVPPIPETRDKVQAELSGSYLVGEGEYQVNMVLVDDQNRKCTDDWKIRARLNDTVRDVRPGLPPGVVDDITLRRWRRMRAEEETGEKLYNMSILMHASAMFPGRVRLRGGDRMLLLSALTTLIERLPVRNIRLTIFSMDQQQEIYHTPDLTLHTFREAVDALEGVELGTVDYSTLKKPKGHVDLVEDLLERELKAAEPPDAVVFLGPVAHYTDRVKNDSLAEKLGSRPIYFVQLRPFRLAFGIVGDSIDNTVRRLGGKTKLVYSPQDFAEAIQELERILESTSGN